MENKFEVVIGEDELRQRVRLLGAEISRDYAGKTPVLVAVLKGSVVFLADLVRAITIPVNLDFMAITSFGSGGGRGGVVRIAKDLDIPISGREVIIVEDIIDTGLTLGYLIKSLRARDPADVAVCTLLDRRARRLTKLPIRYVGFEVPDRFLVGYGLDQREEHRNLPFLAALPEEGASPAAGGGPGAASES
jgi:hypoxanthine phosphoribosyltransferase